MDDTGGTTAHRELIPHVRELLKAIRLIKQQLATPTSTVPPGSFGVLSAIAAGTGSHVKDLALENALDPSTISRAVAALVRCGLVERAADPHDGRACVLSATAAGHGVLEDILTRYDDHFAAALSGWTPDELHTFTGLLRRFAGDLLTTHETTLEAAR